MRECGEIGAGKDGDGYREGKGRQKSWESVEARSEENKIGHTNQ